MELTEIELLFPGEDVMPSGKARSQRDQTRRALPKTMSNRPKSAHAHEKPGQYRPRRVLSSSMRARPGDNENVAPLHHSLGALVELYRDHSSMESVLLTGSRLVVEMVGGGGRPEGYAARLDAAISDIEATCRSS